MSSPRNRGDRREEGRRARARKMVLKAQYLSGEYVVGTYAREATCEGCSKVFPLWRGGKMRFCSRACAGIDKGAEHVLKRKRLRRSAYKVRKAEERRTIRSCKGCGCDFKPARNGLLYCAPVCRSEAEKNKRLEADKAAYKLHALRSCRCCGQAFRPTYGDKRSVYCSPRCLRKQVRRDYGKNHRQRARRYGVHYEPVNRTKVFERDGWRCQICGIATPKKLMGTFVDNAPELDHRIPMAPPHNGPHTWANVQCACRRCNGIKGASLILGQQPLFAQPQ